MPPSFPAAPSSSRFFSATEWILVAGLMATFAGTSLCLGGYLAETMAVAGPAVLGLGVLGLVLWAGGRGGEAPVFNRAALLPLPFLLFALVGTLGWAPAGWLAWREWLLWLEMWVVFALVLHFGRSPAQTSVIAGTFVMLAVLGAGMAIYQRYSDPGWIMLGRRQASAYAGRSSGMFGIPNSFAALLELLIPVCVALLFSRAVKPTVKVMCGWCLALATVGLVLTVSRGGWMALGLVLIAWPVLATRRWRRRLLGLAVTVVIVCVGTWALYGHSEEVRHRLAPFLDGRFEVTRPQIWRAGVEIWRDHPWLGSGAGSFNLLFEQHRPPRFWDIPGWTHNDYLNTLSDYGLIGFVLWAGAGGGLLFLGWRGIRRAQRVGTPASNLFGLAKWKLGLWLGLVAFALHLFVDFHTKIPALAYAAAIALGLLLRDETALTRKVPRAAAWGAAGLLAVSVSWLSVAIARPLYVAEGRRFEARRSLDVYGARKIGNLASITASARAELAQAVRIDPANGQAWADFAYVLALEGATPEKNRVWLGHASELAADQALRLCPIDAEFWIRKGTALDLQGRRAEGEGYFVRATQLAPNRAGWWYSYAYHLTGDPGQKAAALEALGTCLGLDPYFPRAESLRQQLLSGR